jgi:hypothetical protein
LQGCDWSFPMSQSIRFVPFRCQTHTLHSAERQWHCHGDSRSGRKLPSHDGIFSRIRRRGKPRRTTLDYRSLRYGPRWCYSYHAILESSGTGCGPNPVYCPVQCNNIDCLRMVQYPRVKIFQSCDCKWICSILFFPS